MFWYKLIQAVCFDVVSTRLDSHRLTSTLFHRPQALKTEEIATVDRLKGVEVGTETDRSSSEKRRKRDEDRAARSDTPEAAKLWFLG